MYQRLRPAIYRLAPEEAHRATVALLRLAGAFPPARTLVRRIFGPAREGPAVQAFGLSFSNPVGLAAGYDKDGLAWRGLAELGFGHIEVGTVTPKPQPGNPEPRIFRLVDDRAVINRMGFPSRGSEYLAGQLHAPRPRRLILGVNIGKNKATALEEAVGDYLSLMRVFAPLADYLAINVSSPNTPGLRALQGRRALEELLAPLAAERHSQVLTLGRSLPLLVKLAPELANGELDDALDVILSTGMDGVIVSNTTLRRENLQSRHAGETGGLSGAPLKQLNTELVRVVAARTAGKLPIVASGGIMRPEDVREKLDAGAILVQLYTGLIYEGPGLVRKVFEHGFA